MLASLLLIAAALAGQAPAADADALKAEVHALVRQLDSPKLEKRQAAEKKLIGRGPQVLDLLPTATEDMSSEVKERLARIRQALQQVAAEAATQASPITLHSPGMKLSKVLAELQKQSGNPIVDGRKPMGQPTSDPELKVDFDKTPFWKALDTVLDQAGLTVSSNGQQRGITVVARGAGQPLRSQASYSGPFRFQAVRVAAVRDLHAQPRGVLTVTVEVAWEPHVRPIGLKQLKGEVTARDEDGKPLAVEDPKGEVESMAQGDASAAELELPLALPPRRVSQIASLKGSLQAMVPGKIETFRFGNLLTAKNVEKRIAGATVTLEQVQKNNELWEVHMRLRFDDAGNALDSFRGWILQNEAFLEDPAGKPIPYGSYDTTDESKNEIGLTYIFSLKQPPANWKFVYKTPGVIVTTAFPYELKDIKLP